MKPALCRRQARLRWAKRASAIFAGLALLLQGDVCAQDAVLTGSASVSSVKPTAQLSAIRKESDQANSPIELTPAKVTRSFHLRLGQRELIPRILSAYGIQAIIDQSVSIRTVPFDATGVDFLDAVRLMQLATNTFLVPLNSHQALIIDDSKENRAQYQRQITETVHFPGLRNSELGDMENIARNVVGIDQAIMQPSQGTITFRAPEAELDALNRIYSELLRGRSEVLLDVHVYEVDRTNEMNAGLILPNSATLFNVRSAADSLLANDTALVQEIVQSGEATAGDWQKILAILIASGALSGTVFNNPFVVFGGGLTETGAEWNTSAANTLLSSSGVKSLKQIQLRVQDQDEATFHIGERYPIMTSRYSIGSIVPDSSSSITPQVQYVDLGLTLKAKPYVEGAEEITLRLELDETRLAGPSLNSIPVLTNRQYSGDVSVHPGYSALMLSALSKQDSRELTGVPGAGDLPDFGNATNRLAISEEAEFVVLITPHIIRLAHPEISGPIRPLSER